MFARPTQLVKPISSFDPATLALSGWYRADYAGAPWSPTASAGASASCGNMVTVATGYDATVGTAQNGKFPAQFTASGSKQLISANNASSFITSTAGSILSVFYLDSVAAYESNMYTNAALFNITSAYWGMGVSTYGVSAFVYNSGFASVDVAASTGSWHIAMMRYNGSTLGLRVDSGAEVTVSAAGTLDTTSPIYMARGYGGTHYLDGRILETITMSSYMSDTDYANIKTYVNSRYALAL